MCVFLSLSLCLSLSFACSPLSVSSSSLHVPLLRLRMCPSLSLSASLVICYRKSHSVNKFEEVQRCSLPLSLTELFRSHRSPLITIVVVVVVVVVVVIREKDQKSMAPENTTGEDLASRSAGLKARKNERE